jgi:hypothetical protein
MSAPDVDPRQGEAALMAQQQSAENLAWMQKIYDTDLAPLARRQQDLAEENARLGMDIAKENQGWATQDRQFLVENYRPVEQQMVADVAKMNTADYANQKAQEAGAVIEDQYSAAQAQANRNLTRQGIAVGSAQRAATELNGSIAKAGLISQARTQAREGAVERGFQRQAAVSQIGRGINPNISSNTALGAGSSAISGVGQALAGASGATAGVQNASQGAVNANLGAANQFGQINAANAQANAGFSGALGSVAGALITKLPMFSDENMKEDIKSVDGKKALKGLREAEPKAWRYKAGVADEGEHVGAMAQDLKKSLGPTVSDGKTVDAISMIGTLHKGLVEVDKRIDKVMKKIDTAVSHRDSFATA